jgi:hypothetical protein
LSQRRNNALIRLKAQEAVQRAKQVLLDIQEGFIQCQCGVWRSVLKQAAWEGELPAIGPGVVFSQLVTPQA